ncbi:hypothetical protein GA0074695_5459 [Micromonospora viridifaciens]|uniref:Uncharacterized protein n=1 Tax=Micromonospora viridifaciens TaxID=1881 RepID=A0A1C4ZEF8_MICVI|nr:hypothetical protein [Micromonospora viridifaciens]SCF31246.1 hypothetical protein GA0074695_5459 [Micromonospora viridifaciens]
MTVEGRGSGSGSDVLIRKVDSHLTALRAGLHGPELALAEELARCLRELVVATAHSSAADRGLVRAAVHYFVLRRESRGKHLPVRSLAAAQRVVNKAVRQLGRPDLLVETPRERPAPEPTTTLPARRV